MENFRVIKEVCANCKHLSWVGKKPGCGKDKRTFSQKAGKTKHIMCSSCVCDEFEELRVRVLRLERICEVKE